MNYVRRSTCALIFALACIANAHANLETIVSAVTSIPDNCFSSAKSSNNPSAFTLAYGRLNEALKTVAGQTLLARATKELVAENGEEILLDAVTIEKIQTAVQDKVASFGPEFINAIQPALTSFIDTLSIINKLPVLDDAKETVLDYLDEAGEKIFTDINPDLEDLRTLIKAGQKVSTEEHKQILQSERDVLSLFLLGINADAICYAASQHAYQLLNALNGSPVGLACFAENQEHDTLEEQAIQQTMQALKKADQKKIVHNACAIAQCIRKTAYSDQCQQLVEKFIEIFTQQAALFPDTMLDNVSSVKKIATLRNNITKAKKDLLLAARIVLAAGQENDHAFEDFDFTNFSGQITELKGRLQSLSIQALELETALTLSALTTPLTKKVMNSIKSFWNAIPSFDITGHLPEPVSAAGEGEEADDADEAPEINYGLFEDIATTLTDLDAAQADKVTVLKVLRAQAEAIFNRVNNADYDVHAQRQPLTNVVDHLIFKFGHCFANVDAATAFINENAPGQNRKAHVKAHTNMIKSKLTVEGSSIIRNSINVESQAALTNFATILTNIYNAANAIA